MIHGATFPWELTNDISEECTGLHRLHSKAGGNFRLFIKALYLPFQDRWEKNNIEKKKRNLFAEHLISEEGVVQLLAL